MCKQHQGEKARREKAYDPLTRREACLTDFPLPRGKSHDEAAAKGLMYIGSGYEKTQVRVSEDDKKNAI